MSRGSHLVAPARGADGDHRIDLGVGLAMAHGVWLAAPIRSSRPGKRSGGQKDQVPLLLAVGATALGHVHGNVLHLTMAEFETFTHAVTLHTERARTVAGRLSDAKAYNLVAHAAGNPPKIPSPGRTPPIRAMTPIIAGDTDLDEHGREELLDLTRSETRAAAHDNPVVLGKLRRDIDLVTLEALITQFRDALTSNPAARLEKTWQAFFRANTFALQQLFAAPVVYVEEQVTVRAPNLKGSGMRHPDFLLANTITRAVHLVEIKTPATKLVHPKPYRGDVFAPHRALSGAVAQLHAQIQSARADLPMILKHTPNLELDPGIIRGAVIAGTLSSLNHEQTASFVRYRDGLSGIEVLTYDEVVTRLESLHSMLTETTTLNPAST